MQVYGFNSVTFYSMYCEVTLGTYMFMIVFLLNFLSLWNAPISSNTSDFELYFIWH